MRTPRGPLPVSQTEEWKPAVTPGWKPENQWRERTWGRPRCTSTDVDFHTPLGQSESSQQWGSGVNGVWQAQTFMHIFVWTRGFSDTWICGLVSHSFYSLLSWGNDHFVGKDWMNQKGRKSSVMSWHTEGFFKLSRKFSNHPLFFLPYQSYKWYCGQTFFQVQQITNSSVGKHVDGLFVIPPSKSGGLSPNASSLAEMSLRENPFQL